MWLIRSSTATWDQMNFLFYEQMLKHPGLGRDQHQGSRSFAITWVSFQASQMKVKGNRSLLDTGLG